MSLSYSVQSPYCLHPKAPLVYRIWVGWRVAVTQLLWICAVPSGLVGHWLRSWLPSVLQVDARPREGATPPACKPASEDGCQSSTPHSHVRRPINCHHGARTVSHPGPRPDTLAPKARRQRQPFAILPWGGGPQPPPKRRFVGRRRVLVF